MRTRHSSNGNVLKLYTDGGVIQKNPSSIGGTWAWCLVLGDTLIKSNSGIIVPTDVVQFPNNLVTNNQTELFAIVQGLSQLQDNDVVEVCSDSLISLGRVFGNSPFNNIPSWLVTSLDMQKKRLTRWKEFSFCLISGHPTKKELEDGIGKRGYLTSKWNVLCDELCNRASREYMRLA